MPTNHQNQETALLKVFLEPIQKCADYKPAFGLGRSGGLSLKDFQVLYGSDLFYTWLGLDNPAVYAAHKTAGGLTSIYRQIGIGSERLFREVLKLSLNLSEEQVEWQYEYDKPEGKTGTHTLDACIKMKDLERVSSKRMETWLNSVTRKLGGSSSETARLSGLVFEVRQGYKSADSKRQNADLRYGVRAYQSGLLPCFVIMSSQISEPIIRRYRTDGLLVLTGIMSDDPTLSTFAFFEQVIGFDLAGFFVRNQDKLKTELRSIVEKLLSPH